MSPAHKKRFETLSPGDIVPVEGVPVARPLPLPSRRGRDTLPYLGDIDDEDDFALPPASDVRIVDPLRDVKRRSSTYSIVRPAGDRRDRD